MANKLTIFLLIFILQNKLSCNGCKNPNIECKNPVRNNLELLFKNNEASAGTITKLYSTDLLNKRPNFSNILLKNHEQIKDIFNSYYLKRRFKRKSPTRNVSRLLRKRLNYEKKLEELMAADANPRLEPNYTAVGTTTQFKHISDEQLSHKLQEQLRNKQTDKIRELRRKHNASKFKKDFGLSVTDCNFENDCLWTWRKDIANGFFITSGSQLTEHETGPKTDANNQEHGSFLLLRPPNGTVEYHVTSPLFTPSRNTCRLQLWIYQELMEGAEIRIVGDKTTNHSQSINNHTQWVVEFIRGDNSKTWKKYELLLGKISENFTIIIEVVSIPTLSPNATVAFDNIALASCYPKNDDSCVPHQYRCKSNSTPTCINNTSVCDITKDCKEGDDETQNCDRMPFGARCTFEEDWCGWYNVEGKTLEWSRNNGSTPTNFTGPNYDHTYMNSTGKYLYVNMLKDDAAFASSASLKSVIFNPPPRVHGNISSRFYNSCAIRFYLHQTGKHKSGILLQVTELRPTDNYSTDILWSYVNYDDKWIRQVVILPNITHKYFIHFDAKRGYRFISDIAIDDVSLSPECFGINVPPEELDGYSYWNPLEEQTAVKETHPAFINETYYEITTCNATGRFGPTHHECTKTYNGTKVKIKVLHEPGLSGIQKWIVPKNGFYTFILVGASGGKGSGAMGSSRGAMVRIVVELRKSQEIYMLIGQEGTSACVKSLGYQLKSSCLYDKNDTAKGIRGVLYMDINDGGGGGGGATYLFLRNKTKHSIPLAVAAGGGGLGLGRFLDTAKQHGQAINMSRPPITGRMYGKRSAGAGGGWRMFPGLLDANHKQMMGRALSDGGIGGKACYNSTNNRGDGGFGGGGGGCSFGGGGGGYAGGDAFLANTTNGEGGYSFIDPSRTVPNLSEAHSGYNAGSGSILIIPVISGCDCNYRCVALDPKRSQTVCICPKNWKLDSDGKTCLITDLPPQEAYPTWFVIGLITTVICLTVAFAVVCFILYNRYQQRASGILRRKILSGADLQLDRLRVASDSMMTEYNPNYEFGGVVYTLKDLKDIPREQLRLVKALGQGAFGEVYQGFYRQRPCDTVEMPVAVKTLPEMSTSQAEMDFLMEALIMSKFNHPNIVHFIGVCFDKHPRFIVLELLAGGDLKNFLRESRPKPERSSPLTMKDLVLIAVDVAKGCKYLEDNRFIHRDIAARNCLLTTKGPGRVVKIADFGMSRDVYRSDYYRKGGKAMLPIKWMPPEAFLDGIFTSKTDIWSFGVLLWEILSMGYMPYTGCANREVMQLVTSGGRLDPPANCPGPIYGIMTQCWHPTPEQRPTFSTVLERLGYCVQDPQVMEAPLPVFHRPPSNERDTTVMRPLSSDENCLQVVPQSSDYLIPNHTIAPNAVGSTSSVEKLLPDNSDSWETSFIMPESRSTQPLLLECEQNKEEDDTNFMNKLLSVDNNTSVGKVSPVLLSNNVTGVLNNNVKSIEMNSSSLKSGISLDAGALAKQSMSSNPQKNYTNLKASDGTITGNGVVVQNGPTSIPNQNNYNNCSKNSKYLNETEINC